MIRGWTTLFDYTRLLVLLSAKSDCSIHSWVPVAADPVFLSLTGAGARSRLGDVSSASINDKISLRMNWS